MATSEAEWTVMLLMQNARAGATTLRTTRPDAETLEGFRNTPQDSFGPYTSPYSAHRYSVRHPPYPQAELLPAQ